MRYVQNLPHAAKHLRTILGHLSFSRKLQDYWLRLTKRCQRSSLRVVVHCIVGVSVAAISSGAPMNATSYADSSTQIRAALAMYSFQNLRAMPLINNRSVSVGDVIDIGTESVLRSAEVCYPNLSERETSSGHDMIAVSYETALQLTGIAEMARFSDFEADLQQVLFGHSVLLMENLKGYAPDPDQYELDRSKVSPDVRCQLVQAVLNGNSTTSILASSVYHADISGGFYFENREMQDVNVSANSLRWLLGHASIGIHQEDVGSTIHLTDRNWGSVAVQALRLDLKELARLYTLFGENPESIAKYERQVYRYLTGDDPSLLEEVRLVFLDFWEWAGLRLESIEDLKRRLIEKGTVVTAEEIQEIPQEWWDAAGVVGAGVEIVGSDGEKTE